MEALNTGNSNDIIAALVDGELNDKTLKEELLERIKTDKELQIEFKVQSLMKSLVREKCSYRSAPQNLREKIDRKIKPKKNAFSLENLFPKAISQKSALAFGSIAAIVIISVLLIIFNTSRNIQNVNFAVEQSGNDNMFIQAKDNFNKIIKGQLSPQFLSHNPQQIQHFFSEKGVDYSTVVPTFNKWKLLGAVVSVDQGIKFAHQVYVNDKGKIMYIFQVKESMLESNGIINLSHDLIHYLDAGNCYVTHQNGHLSIMKKVKDNIFAIQSNSNTKETINLFCK